MVDAWPGSLPQAFEQSGYGEGVADMLTEVQPDTGPPITRRRSTAATRPVGGSMVLTSAQLSALKTFFNTTLLGGSLPFTFPAQVDAGSPAVDWLVKFTKSALPKWTPLGGDYWRASFGLTVLP